MGDFQRFYRSLCGKRFNIWLSLVAIIVAVMLAGFPTTAQLAPQGNEIDGFPVVLDGQEVFRVRYGLPEEGVSAQERATILNQRLQQLANSPAIAHDSQQPASVQRSISYTTSSPKDNRITIIGTTVQDDSINDDGVLVTIRDQDTEKLNMTREDLARNTATEINQAVANYQLKQRNRQTALTIFIGLMLGLLAIFLLLKILFRIQNSPQPAWLNTNRWMQWGLVPLALLGFVAISLYALSMENSILPNFVNQVINQFQTLIKSLIQYLPNLIVLLVIASLTFLTIALARLLLSELGKDTRAAWFDQEWTQPTVGLVTLLITAIGAAIAMPYLPGFGTSIFLAIFVILGLLFVLSSYSVLANAIAGLVLIYSSNLKDDREIALTNSLGHLITSGRLKKSLFVSQITLDDGKQIFIPNSSLLNNFVTLQPIPNTTEQK